MGIKRVINRTFEELYATFKIASKTSFIDALITFIAKIDIQIMSRNGYKESKTFKKHLLKKHKVMIRYFQITFKDYLANYKLDDSKYINDKDMSDTIWMIWWQGVENAPQIVKTCIDSIKRNCGSKKLVIITNENYRDFIQVPAWIEEKRKNGIISNTHFSDICRLYLLSTYGGMWLDATFYCCGNLEEYFKYPLWSIKRPDYLHASIASGYFATYSLKCDFDKRWIFKIILDLYMHYWEISERQIDYLTLDYMFVLAQMINKDVKKAFEEIEPNNPECDELYKILGNSFDKDKWEEIKKDTNLFKLSWKHKFPSSIKGEKKVFYDKLIEGKLK